MAPAMERHRITARVLITEVPRIIIRVPVMEVPGITARVMAMETRTVTMEHMAAIQNQRRKRKKENRVDLENSLQNVQRLHLYSDWLQAVS